MVPENLLYTQEHEWAQIQGDIATIGITDHAQEALGEITYFELPQVNTDIQIGKEIGSAESSKAASDIYSPVSGKIIEVNNQLAQSPELVNQDCYGKGWICKIKLTGKADSLMDAKKYQEYLDANE